MSFGSRPPAPLGQRWDQWAESLNIFLVRSKDRLRWFLQGDSATENGILLWDQTQSAPVVSLNGEWIPLLTGENPLDFGIQIAEAEILNTYGDTVSTVSKAKTLLKFGKKDDLGTSLATVWQTDTNETYCTTNAIDRVVSSAADSTDVRIEGHTVTGTGTSSQFTFVVQDATLNGQTPVTLTTPLARVSRMYDISSAVPTGDIRVFESTSTVTAGVPDDNSKVHILIKGSAGETQSYKAATTFSNTDYFICTGGFASVDKKTSATVDFEMQVRQAGGVFRPVARLALDSSAQTSQQISFYPYAIVPKNSDIRIVATASATGTEVSAQFQGFLAEVV